MMAIPILPAKEFLAMIGYYVLKIRWNVDMIETIDFYEILCKKLSIRPCRLSKIYREYYDERNGWWTISDKEIYQKIFDEQKPF
jgi:hypothetical protein